MRSSPERAVRVRALAGDIVLCSWARHFTLTVPLSTQVYKWVPANLKLRVTLRWASIASRGQEKYFETLHATETGISSDLIGSYAERRCAYEMLPLFFVSVPSSVLSFVRHSVCPFRFPSLV